MSVFPKVRYYISERWNEEAARTKLAAKNIIYSIFLKFSSILASLLIVPMTIHYIDSTQYGIWMTISSIVAWANFFDLGLANGFRNKFAQSLANGDISLAQQYVSTTYAIIGSLMTVVLVIILIVNHFLNWSNILNVSQEYQNTLNLVFAILSTFFCMNMIVNIFVKLLEGDQRPAIASAISCIGQIVSLVSIFLLTKITEGSLIKLALYFSSMPFITMLLSSIILFNYSKYKVYKPTLSGIRLSLGKNIIGLGFKFFIIYLCLILVFHLMNIVLSREVGPLAVTQYTVTNKYFSVIYMLSAIVVGPMWSAFTDAYTKQDYNWMKRTLSRLEKWYIIVIGISLLALCLSPILYKIWLGNSVNITFILSVCVMIYILSQIGSNIFTTIMCGVGHMQLQTYIYICAAIISYPAMSYCTQKVGIYGVMIVPSIVCFVQTIVCRIQLKKIINKTATGIWMK